ncbi:protein ENHANCED PSEUDOMONAS SUSCEPTIBILTY 1-like [Cucurbita moschata]|uniref:Protein ENHANCED PSEUDOMONAS SUSCEPTIBILTY 1-like n=1 Tax=Cucurbita moschata TaxID=3662 RepID=A0A6J1FMB9_CUCMO|nr:protein ENHANCED PSEUDOMONAS SUSCEPTIBILTY 1-like [Cucurbita moschata]
MTIPTPSSSPILLSKCIVFPDQPSSVADLKLSVSDLPMLSCHYIQKGCLFTSTNLDQISLLDLLKSGLSRALSRFPPLAGRLVTDDHGYVYIKCNDAGVEFIHANACEFFVRDLLVPGDLPEGFKEFFAFDRMVSFAGHFSPIMAVQITFLADGIFIGCSVNHAVTDGTSFWNFFNTFAEECKAAKSTTTTKTITITPTPDFRRDSVLVSPAVLRLPPSGPEVTFSNDVPLRERIFSFSRESILKLKAKTNEKKLVDNGDLTVTAVEIMGKQSNDMYCQNNGKVGSIFDSWYKNDTVTKQHADSEAISMTTISSFQSLCALLWRSVTRARKLPPNKTTTFRMAVNCRHRLEPKLDPYYFGNAIQSIPTCASVGDVLSRDLRWCAEKLNENVIAHDNGMVRRFVEDWEANPGMFPLGNADGASVTMGSSPRFPMYENDFGWGRPLAVRSGRANKFDGKISAFPNREGGGSIDLEVVLAPETMAGIESDSEFMQYVTAPN